LLRRRLYNQVDDFDDSFPQFRFAHRKNPHLARRDSLTVIAASTPATANLDLQADNRHQR
jgi:hypothetical protein